ncbi:uncharacterized protein K441DRAFT_589446 [Cenococcum geophilum 1.58]|uniref:Uncharacterized protein n=1 Tax=Cenococcum geophilum 1.58 TaxID=794803 RepID=A0ACC8ER29_9PEZI|nr:hypothetical protein K441DRAFT_589446 [Cenococcum geophilum 1.58]
MLPYKRLYLILKDELLVIKKYINKYLNKGFIRPTPITLLILFIKKLNRGLYFYINYYKLNNITRKDRYPLPLFNKTLA